MDLTDALMLMTSIGMYLNEVEEDGRIKTPGDVLVMNPIKRAYKDMCDTVINQATAEEIREANRESDELYCNF